MNAPSNPANPFTEKRQNAERLGRRAEWLAAFILIMKGFSIVERRFKAAGGEVDIAARRGSLLVLVEVKARASLDEAVFAVTPKTRRRIEAAGRALLARRPRLAECALRYDIIAVSGWRVRHLADAWRESDRS